MTREEASQLKLGLYRVYWKGEDEPSIAAVGMLHDGTRWFAPTNWTSKEAAGIACTKWRMVSHVAELTYDW